MTSGHTCSMKTAVSIPDPLFAEAEKAARELNISRSKLVQTALEEFLERRRDAAITEAINRSLAECPEDPDPLLEALALETLKRVEWDE